MAKRQEERRILARERFEVDERTRGSQSRAQPVNAMGSMSRSVVNRPFGNEGQAWRNVSSALGGILSAFEKQQAKAEREADRQRIRAEDRAEREAQRQDILNGTIRADEARLGLLERELNGEFEDRHVAIEAYKSALSENMEGLGPDGVLAMRGRIVDDLFAAAKRVEAGRVADHQAARRKEATAQLGVFFNGLDAGEYEPGDALTRFQGIRSSLASVGYNSRDVDSFIEETGTSIIKMAGKRGDPLAAQAAMDFLLNHSGISQETVKGALLAERLSDAYATAQKEERDRRNASATDEWARKERRWRDNDSALLSKLGNALTSEEIDSLEVEWANRAPENRADDHSPALAAGFYNQVQNQRLFLDGKRSPGYEEAMREIREGMQSWDPDFMHGTRLYDLRPQIPPAEFVKIEQEILAARADPANNPQYVAEIFTADVIRWFDSEGAAIYKGVELSLGEDGKPIPTPALHGIRKFFQTEIGKVDPKAYADNPEGLKRARYTAAQIALGTIKSGQATFLLEEGNRLEPEKASLDPRYVKITDYDSNQATQATVRNFVLQNGASRVEQRRRADSIQDPNLKHLMKGELSNQIVQDLIRQGEERKADAERYNLMLYSQDSGYISEAAKAMIQADMAQIDSETDEEIRKLRIREEVSDLPGNTDPRATPSVIQRRAIP